jgi:hypothetical protein
MQCRILMAMPTNGWITRPKIIAIIGQRKGYARAMGAPTKGEPKPGTLEYLRYVEVKRPTSSPLEYKITKSGIAARKAFGA